MQANFPSKAHDGAFKGSCTYSVICRYLVFTFIYASAHYGAQLDVQGNLYALKGHSHVLRSLRSQGKGILLRVSGYIH